MKELNSMRLLAGIPIDGSIEITEKTPVTEAVRLNEAAKDAAIKDFWCVKKVTKPDTKLSDCLRGTNTQGLCHMIRDSSEDECDDLLIFASGDKAAATKEAKKRIRTAQKSALEAEEEAFFQNAEQEYEEEVEYEEATSSDDGTEEESMYEEAKKSKKADKDYDGDGKVESSEEEHKGVIKKKIEKTNEAQNMTDHVVKDGDFFWIDREFEGKTVSKPGDKITFESNGKMLKAVVTKTAKGRDDDVYQLSMLEAIETLVAPDSWEDDEEKAVNAVDGNGKTTAPFKDVESSEIKSVDKKGNATDTPVEDKDESPQQLHALDTASEQDQSGGNDRERKLPCPARIKNLLKTEANDARAKAKKLSISDREDAYFYDDLANAFEDLYNHLDGGTVYDVKKAQIYMTSLMGPILHKIPADVVNWVAKGGNQRSLKSYMTKVDAKYPITGPRNALN